jgi:protein arginine N-methyltransferase 1
LANGLTGRWTLIHGHSHHVVLPEQVDVVLCDQIGHFGIEGDMLADVSDARRRFLKPGGVVLPATVDLLLAPVEAPRLFGQVEFWGRRLNGFDLSPGRQWAANSGCPTTLSRDMLLGAPITIASLDMSTATSAPFVCRATMSVERNGTLHGLGGWFSARLSPSVTLTNAPTASARLSRRNVYFPIDAAVEVRADDIVAVDMHITPPDMIVWSVEVRRGSTTLGRFRHSTLKGMLFCREQLQRMNPRFTPTLTDRGEGRLSVLTLCDGQRSLADVEREVFVRHPNLFTSIHEAAAFVAETVTRYTR